MEFGDANELFETNALERIDIAFFAAIGCDRQRELAGSIPTDGPLLRKKLGQITEKGHAGEGGVARVRARVLARIVVGKGVGG